MYEVKITRVINQIMNSENFRKAAEEFVDRYLHVFTSYKYIVKMQSDEGRYLVALQQAAFLFDPQSESELTATALHSFAVENQLCTKSRVSANLALAVLGRYLLWEPSPNDRRMKIFKPTERYLQLARDTFNYYAYPLAIIDQEKFGHMVGLDLRQLGRISRESTRIYLSDLRIVRTIRGMHLISYRDGGFEIFVRMLKQAEFFTDDAKTKIDLPFSQIARELSISRSQVQKLIKALSEIGLLTLHEDGGKNIEITPAFKSFANEVVASVLGVCAAATLTVRNIDLTDQQSLSKLR